MESWNRYIDHGTCVSDVVTLKSSNGVLQTRVSYFPLGLQALTDTILFCVVSFVGAPQRSIWANVLGYKFNMFDVKN